jgi:hypothetical protein
VAARQWSPPAAWTPGEVLAIDWGSGLRVFCAVPAWPRVRFARFADNQRSDTTLANAGRVLRGTRWVSKVVQAYWTC